MLEKVVIDKRSGDASEDAALAGPAVANVVLDELFVRWQQGCDQRARAQLVDRFMPLVRKLARRYAGREPFDDLLQVASIGLLKAIDRFDPGHGAAFSSFAMPTILGELKRHFRARGGLCTCRAARRSGHSRRRKHKSA